MTAVSRQGINVLTGGIGEDERQQLFDTAAHYDVVASFVRRSDGAYFGSVDVVLNGSNLEQPLELTTNGPLLLASLAEGDYVLEARVPGWKARVRDITVEREHHERIYLTFVPEDALDD